MYERLISERLFYFSYFQNTSRINESSEKLFQQRRDSAKQSLEKRFLENQEKILCRETDKNTRQPLARVDDNQEQIHRREETEKNAGQPLSKTIIDNKEQVCRREPEQNPNPSYYDNRPISIYPLELRAGNQSEDYHRSAFISKKKKVLDNPTNSDLAVYRVSSEPCLQKKRITMYPKNHNILRTFTVKEEASIFLR